MDDRREWSLKPWILGGAVALAVISATVLWWNRTPGLRPTIEDQGGVILSYQLDRDGDTPQGTLESMASALRIRLESDQLGHVTVRTRDADYVDILIPDLGNLEAEVQRVKMLASKVGLLEFRILANWADDREAIAAAVAQFAEIKANDPELLSERARKGLPPPALTEEGDAKRKRRFDITLPKGMKSRVTYDWVQLGPNELVSLRLDPASAKDPQINQVWLQAQANLNTPTLLQDSATTKQPLLQGALFLARPCVNEKLPLAERQANPVEYFVLARDPEIDLATDQPTAMLNGSFLTSALMVPSGQSFALYFNLNKAGADIMSSLSGKNVPDTDATGVTRKRHLAILLDGAILSAPTINSQIYERGQITGNFTRREVEMMVAIFRAGALPGRLKTQPSAEKTVRPSKKTD